jgi:hypothetical protein
MQTAGGGATHAMEMQGLGGPPHPASSQLCRAVSTAAPSSTYSGAAHRSGQFAGSGATSVWHWPGAPGVQLLAFATAL